jgi:hypothetical protein
VVAVSDVELSAKLERFRDVLVWCNLWRLQVDEGEFSVDKHPSLTASARGEAEPTPGSGDGR